MEEIHEIVEQAFRQESGRVLAALISKLGDFTLAEDVLQDALVMALTRWQADGVPRNPGAWLLTTAWHKAIDLLRRKATFERKQEEVGLGSLRKPITRLLCDRFSQRS